MLAVSIVTQMELIVGCQDKTELRAVERFLSRFHVLKLNEQISEAAVDLLRRYRLSHGLADCRCVHFRNSPIVELSHCYQKPGRLPLHRGVDSIALPPASRHLMPDWPKQTPGVP